MNSFGKELYLFLGFQNRELRSLHDGVATDILKAELLFVFLGLWLYDPAHQFLYLWNKPDEHKRVGHVEGCVECRKDDRKTRCQLLWSEAVVVRIIVDKLAYRIDKRVEQA